MEIELSKKILEYKISEEHKRYINGIVIEICNEILKNSNNKIYKHNFNIFENNYVLKKVKDTLLLEFPSFEIELDAEHKFLLIDWSKY
jgi:hypothetical protein